MDPETFLGTFFGTSNRLRWQRLPEEFGTWLEPWLDRVRRRHFPIFLPRWTDDRSMVWYAGAGSASATSELRELISAFVGPSYASFSGRLAVLDATDPVDGAATDFLGTAVYKFTVPNREDSPAVRASLDRLRKLLDERPTDRRQLRRPVGRILRDFELALVGGDDQLSAQLIGELLANGHLSAANLSFLEVVRMAELHDWDGVLAHPNLALLLEMRRPTRVTLALTEALYRHILAPFEEAGNVAGAVAAMRNVVLPRYGPLFESLPSVGPYSERMLLLLGLANDAKPDMAARQLLEMVAGTQDSFVQLLAAAVRDVVGLEEREVTRDPADEARDLIANGQMQVAMSILAKMEPSLAIVATMVLCAYELNTLESAGLAAAAIDALAPGEQQLLPGTRQFQQMLNAIRALVGAERERQESPKGWREWFDVVSATPGSHRYAVRWAEAGVDEWDSATFEDSEAVESIASRFGHGSDATVAIQREALPFFLKALSAAPPEARRRLHLQVLDTLLYRGTRTRAELQTLLDVLEATIGDLDPNDYRRVVGDLTDIWSEVQAPSSMEWALQLLDVLIVQPCRDTTIRQALAISILGTAAAHLRRLDLAVRLTLNETGRDLQLPPETLLPTVQEEDDQDPLSALRGQRVAIYTLTEGAGVRARDRLSKWTQRRVEILNDKVCTESLRAAAREADIFVMVTRSAKHPATDCVKTHRPEGSPLVITSGKGSSSVMYAVRQFLLGDRDPLAN